jgi:hypothetical protein
MIWNLPKHVLSSCATIPVMQIRNGKLRHCYIICWGSCCTPRQSWQLRCIETAYSVPSTDQSATNFKNWSPRTSASRELGCRFGFYEEVYIYILNTSKHRSKAADTFPQEHLLPNICGLEFSSPISTYFKKLSTSQWSNQSGK